MVQTTIYLTGFFLTRLCRLAVSYPLCSFVFLIYISLSLVQSKVIVPALENARKASPEPQERDVFYGSKVFCCLDAALVVILLISGYFYCRPLGVIGVIASVTSVIYILKRFLIAFR